MIKKKIETLNNESKEFYSEKQILTSRFKSNYSNIYTF